MRNYLEEHKLLKDSCVTRVQMSMGDCSQKLGTWTTRHTQHTLYLAQQLEKVSFPGYSVGLSLQAVNRLFPFSLLVLYSFFSGYGAEHFASSRWKTCLRVHFVPLSCQRMIIIYLYSLYTLKVGRGLAKSYQCQGLPGAISDCLFFPVLMEVLSRMYCFTSS